MRKRTWILSVGKALVAGVGLYQIPVGADDEKGPKLIPEGVSPKETVAVKRSEPKPLTANVGKGLDYLVGTQHENGGWGQGGGWRTSSQKQASGGRVEGDGVEDPPDIGNTAVALLAFQRSGHSFSEGKYTEVMKKGADFLLAEIAKNKDDTLYVTSVRDTQLQSKIGAYVDTFLAALVLSELKGKLPEGDLEKRREVQLARVVNKIETHQKEDGTYAGNQGWAATLSQGLGSKALNRAWAAGAGVSDKALRQDYSNNSEGVVTGVTTIAATAGSPSSAGIDIYRYSSQVAGLQELKNSSGKRIAEFQKVVDSKDSPKEEKEKAQAEIRLLQMNDVQTEAAFGAVNAQLQSEQFVAGFGNNGGEEFLSYMNLSEAMFFKGGKEWKDWDAKVTSTVNTAQNKDGSWAGHHCITGRTFCTATALLTLMADRAPIPEPVVAKSDASLPEDAPKAAE
jgi:hypothetical protein